MVMQQLPPMPGSDDLSLKYNTRDRFYNIGARDFWGMNRVEKIKVADIPKEERYFVEVPGGVYDKINKTGLLGPDLKADGGKLYISGEQVKFNN